MRAMKGLDESDIIGIFQRKFGDGNFVSEDVEAIQFGRQRIFVKTDTMVQSTDIPRKMGLRDAARKSVAACISDFASKGIRPEYGMISVNLPRAITKREVNEIADGFKKASREFGFTIVGGDTNQGREIVFNVCIFGRSKRMVTRGGSKRGDLIFVTGPFGYTPIGLGSILSNTAKKSGVASKSIDYFLRPKPRLDFALESGRYFSSAMDSSDGLSATLNTMSRQSNKKFHITNIPAGAEVRGHAKTRKQLVDLVFHGGEEYEFAFTTSPRHRTRVMKIAESLRTPIIQIGTVSSGRGVVLEYGDEEMSLDDLGWRHFS